MNRDRLEMMRVMLMRIHHKSWVPTITPQEFAKNEWLSNIVKPEAFKKFDITHWVYVGRPGQESACPIGFACLDQSFNRLGLHLNGSWPYYDAYTGFGAVDEFFEIRRDISARLFTSMAYGGSPSPRAVAERIQHLLEYGEASFRNRYEYHQ